MSRCRETGGIIISVPCKSASSGHCALCGKPICPEHTRMEQGRPTCITCVRKTLGDSRQRDLKSHLRDDPHFYWYYHRPYGTSYHHDDSRDHVYDGQDYALFDSHDGGIDDVIDESSWEGS